MGRSELLVFRRKALTMQRTAIRFTCFTLIVIAGVRFLTAAQAEEVTAPAAQPDAVPILRFVGFDDIEEGLPVAKLRLTNATTRPIYYSGYGPAHPRKTWERRTAKRWVECDEEWCGTGASNYRLEPSKSIDFHMELWRFDTPEILDDRPLTDDTMPMRVKLYYGYTKENIEHPVVSKPFKAADQ